MKIILIKPVKELGSVGDVVDVSDGYARNYLVPRKLAVKATAGELRQADAMARAHIEAERKAKEAAENLASILDGTRVVVAARAGDEGKLFGSIAAGDVAEAISKFTGIAVKAGIVRLTSPIKDIGLHEVAIKPHAEVDFAVTLDVIPV